MEHNLEDSLNLGEVSDMGFEHCEDIVEGQVDITLETSGHDGDIPMEFEHIEEQPLLMDTGNEEIIDFMGDQFTSFQEYSVQDEQIHDPVSIVEDHQLDEMSSQSETMIDLQFDHQAITSSVRQDYFPKIVSVKAAMPSVPLQGMRKSQPVIARVRRPPLKKPEQLIPIRRQVPIAPKPSEAPRPQPTFGPKLAPKPVALVANRSLTKKVPLSSIVQGNAKGVLAQLGKQLVMVRSGGEQKIKLISTNPGGSTLQYVTSSTDQSQLIGAKPISTSQGKPVMAKVIVQSSGGSGSTMSGARVVVQPRGQMLMTSPTKQGSFNVAKKQQIIAIKSPTGKVVSGASQVPTTKKVVITANPSQNVILKTTAPPKFTQVNKDGTVVTAGQRSQLHQINVPGKGIQYIRLITNQNPVVSKPSTAKPTISLPSKSFVLTDAKGNIIQIRDSAEKYIGDPPALLTTRIAAKPQKKFVRIAPVPTKSMQSSLQPRSSQSLLAPLSPVMESGFDMAELTPFHTATVKTEHVERGDSDGEAGDGGERPGADTKHGLHALGASPHHLEELEIEFEHPQSSIEDETTQSMDADESSQSLEAPLIVIPSNYGKDTQTQPEDNPTGSQLLEDSNGMVNAEGELMPPYMSPVPAQPLSDTEYVSNELGLRPRKACNCTKSQCLKLYCDCFANGEFCNKCNCNNCHNNLENEELRQKAIRACLDRNPNAFRPKIGKSKAGGPEIIRRHNKGCNCKRSGCLKNYCECYEAKIACTAMCKCVGCRNVEDTLEWRRNLAKGPPAKHLYRPEPQTDFKQPCTFMTTEVIEAVCQCLLAAAVEGGQGAAASDEPEGPADPVSDVIDEFARCLQDIISASYQAIPLSLLDEEQA